MAELRVAKTLTVEQHKQIKELNETIKAVIKNNLSKKYLAVRASFPEHEALKNEHNELKTKIQAIEKILVDLRAIVPTNQRHAQSWWGWSSWQSSDERRMSQRRPRKFHTDKQSSEFQL